MADLDDLALQIADRAAACLFAQEQIPAEMVRALAMAVIHASPYLKLATAEQLAEIYERLVIAMHARNAQHTGGVN